MIVIATVIKKVLFVDQHVIEAVGFQGVSSARIYSVYGD